MSHQRHYLSAAWPDMSAEEQSMLRDSIAVSGLREPILLLDGEILDGWQRYQACLAVGVEPTFEVFSGGDPADYVSDKHARRSMTITQRLTAIALMRQWKPAHRPNKSANFADLSAAEMAKQAGASTRTAESVKAAIEHGAPEVLAGMKSGAIAAYKAEEIARLPKDQQREAVHELQRPKKAKFKGRPLKGPKADALRAALKAAQDKDRSEPAPSNAEPAPPEYTALDAAQDQIADLQAALAVASLGEVSEEDRGQAEQLIASLRAEIKSLNAQLTAVTQSRDFLMSENAQMKQQMAAQRREIDRLKNPKGHAAGL